MQKRPWKLVESIQILLSSDCRTSLFNISIKKIVVTIIKQTAKKEDQYALWIVILLQKSGIDVTKINANFITMIIDVCSNEFNLDWVFLTDTLKYVLWFWNRKMKEVYAKPRTEIAEKIWINSINHARQVFISTHLDWGFAFLPYLWSTYKLKMILTIYKN